MNLAWLTTDFDHDPANVRIPLLRLPEPFQRIRVAQVLGCTRSVKYLVDTCVVQFEQRPANGVAFD